MSEKFDYYYGEESESCSFYRIPRLLVLGTRFSGLSTDAKLLYGLMLDRMNLSARNALALVNRVDYFWGGKSLVLGWDDRWGELTEVTAEGSDSTGTEQPYGLDCSGFVDWAFYNASGGRYIIGQGGGAAEQHGNCMDIEWDEVQPGDLLFYPEDEHVGIAAGRDWLGRLLVVHCAAGTNGVAISRRTGFETATRPVWYTDE